MPTPSWRVSSSTATSMTYSISSRPNSNLSLRRKPMTAFSRRTLSDAGKAAMFEDLARNLVVPYALGMTTVLVVPEHTREVFREGWELEGRDAPHVDHVTDDLVGFLQGLAQAS